MDNIEKIANIASSWWSNVVIDPKFDNRDTSNSSFLVTALQKQLTEEVDDTKKAKFENLLKANIFENVQNLTNDYSTCILGCDYGPCKPLYDIGNECGINANNFPWKTTMWISKHHVAVSYGYGASIDILYADKQYYEIKLQRCKDDIEYIKKQPDEYFQYCSKEDHIKECESDINKYEQILQGGEYDD